MNKKLSPLEALERVNKAFHTALIFADVKQKDEETEKALNIIEAALKRLELLESNQIFIERAKKLKALEIIKTHPEQLLDIEDTDNYNEYLDLDYAPDQYLSEENYYLLKEELL